MTNKKDSQFASTKQRQNIIATVLIFCSLAFVVFVAPQLNYVVHGMAYSSTPQLKVQPIAKDKVNVLQQRPFFATHVGHVTSELSINSKYADQQKAVLDFAKEQAGRLGADGLIVRYFGVHQAVLFFDAEAVKL